MQENEKITLEDGRTLCYALYGSDTPRATVIYNHGFPSSRFEGKMWHDHCAKHKIRLISPDRPGYGQSSFQKDRRFLDWPADVLAIVDHLKIKQFYMLGVSGGSPYALACLKEIGKDRLLGVTVASGLYPIKYGTAGMMLPTRILLWVAPWSTKIVTFLFEFAMGKPARNPDPKVFEDMFSKEMDRRHPGDRDAVKNPAYWPTFVQMARESFVQGSEGSSWEAYLNGSDWGFELEELCIGKEGVKLTLWHGDEDMNTGLDATRRAHAAMPESELHVCEGEGHLSYAIKRVDEILIDLVGAEQS